MLNDNKACKTLCTVHDVTGEEAKFINDRIKEDYELNWLVDGLPAAEMKIDTRNQEVFYDQGFNLGNDEGEYQEHPTLNNHYDIMFRYTISLWLGGTFSDFSILQIPQADTNYLSYCGSACLAF